MPNLREATIEAHRREVRDAILDTTVALVNEHGLLSVTMSQVAEQTGIGRATLYKYFPDVEAILLAWHERNITMHLGHLGRLARQPRSSPWARLVAVLEAYALIRQQHPHDGELAALVHRPENLARPQQRVVEFVRPLIAGAAKTGDARDDVAADELAQYCVHALGAATGLRSKAAVRRLAPGTHASRRVARRPRGTGPRRVDRHAWPAHVHPVGRMHAHGRRRYAPPPHRRPRRHRPA